MHGEHKKGTSRRLSSSEYARGADTFYNYQMFVRKPLAVTESGLTMGHHYSTW
ncbi:hypothetical protein BKA93DRAFT_779636 [Sparassis latifolia]